MNEWISTKEELPKISSKYIVCVKNKNGFSFSIFADWSCEMKAWFGELGEIKNAVTHWMPLPEPPEATARHG